MAAAGCELSADEATVLVTVVAGQHRADLELPLDLPLCELAPDILRELGVDPDASHGDAAWTCDGRALAAGDDLRSALVVDGSLLSIGRPSETSAPGGVDLPAIAVAVTVDGRRHLVTGRAVVTLGRAASCDIHVGNDILSRRHNELHWANGQWTLHDMGSSNGTFVHGREITSVAVGEGIVARLGHPATGVLVEIAPQDNGVAVE